MILLTASLASSFLLHRSTPSTITKTDVCLLTGYLNIAINSSEDMIMYHSHSFHLSVQSSEPVMQLQDSRRISICSIGNNLDVEAQRAYSGMECRTNIGTEIDNL